MDSVSISVSTLVDLISQNKNVLDYIENNVVRETSKEGYEEFKEKLPLEQPYFGTTAHKYFKSVMNGKIPPNPVANCTDVWRNIKKFGKKCNNNVVTCEKEISFGFVTAKPDAIIGDIVMDLKTGDFSPRDVLQVIIYNIVLNKIGEDIQSNVALFYPVSGLEILCDISKVSKDIENILNSILILVDSVEGRERIHEGVFPTGKPVGLREENFQFLKKKMIEEATYIISINKVDNKTYPANILEGKYIEYR